jgi:CheY-like chemotaxis protein
MMGGTLWVESEVGIGSTFHVTFAAEPATAEMPPFLAANQPDLQGRCVLIIDGNDSSREILRRYTERWGMQPHAVISAAAALEWIDKHCRMYDVILLNGHQSAQETAALAARMQAVCLCNVPVLALVTLTTRRDLSKAAAAITAFLVKPIRPAMLHAALVSIVHSGPVERRHVFEPQPITPQSGQRHPLRILLAEDNAVNQKVALRVLEKMGYRTDVAVNGHEVLDALRRHRYDVVLMDVQMPEMDGLEATRRIRAEWPAEQQPRIIAMTAHAMESDRQECLAAGMDDYLGKPVQVEELAAKLGRVAREVGRGKGE